MKLSLVNDRDAQGGLPPHRIVYFTLDAELRQAYVLHFLQLIFPKGELILKTFTFAPYCYPYASPSTALSTQPSTLNLRPCTYSNTLAPQIHVVPGIRSTKFVNYSSQE